MKHGSANEARQNQEGCMDKGKRWYGMLTTCRTVASTTSGRLASMAMRGSTTRQCSTSALVSTLPTRIPCYEHHRVAHNASADMFNHAMRE